jgi:hypothetical protein
LKKSLAAQQNYQSTRPVVRPATYSKKQEPCLTEVNAVKDGKKLPKADIPCV